MTQEAIVPPAQYEALMLPNGKLAGRYDPLRGILEIQSAGIKYYFDLTQIKPIDKRNNLCNNGIANVAMR